MILRRELASGGILLITGVGLRNFSNRRRLQLETSALRKARGVSPVAWRKAFVKWLGLA